MAVKLYLIIVLDHELGPYVYSGTDCDGEAGCTASEAKHETGFNTVVKCIEVDLGEKI